MSHLKLTQYRETLDRSVNGFRHVFAPGARRLRPTRTGSAALALLGLPLDRTGPARAAAGTGSNS